MSIFAYARVSNSEQRLDLYIASGPPAHRLEEILALSEAGIVDFLGGDIRVEADEKSGLFRVSGANADTVVTVRALVDARLPEADVAVSDNELIRSLLHSGGA